jgi:phosphoserine phosphatase
MTNPQSNGARVPTEVSATGETLLITVAGPDRPGVTRRLFQRLAAYPLVVLDVEQVVIRGELVLGVLVAQPEGVSTALPEVAGTATSIGVELGMKVTVSPGAGERRSDQRGRLHVTLIGAPLRPEAMGALAGCIADHGGNIDRIERLASYPVTAIELLVSGAEPRALRAALSVESVRVGFDVAVQRAGLHRRGKRLIVMDVDSTLIQGEVIEMLADRAGCRSEVAEITAAAMRGELDFAESLRARVALLEGLDASAVLAVRDEVELAPGARTLVRTLKRLGFQCGVVSGGFTQVTDSLVEQLGLDFAAANTLEVVDGRLTGRLVGDVVDRQGKAKALVSFATSAGVPLSHTVAVGDGANDLDMLERAGLGIAFNAKPLVREAADAAVNVPYLDAVLFLLGITREEIDAADAEHLPPGDRPD